MTNMVVLSRKLVNFSYYSTLLMTLAALTLCLLLCCGARGRHL